MFDFLVAYPLAFFLGLVLACLLPAIPDRTFGIRVRSAAAAGLIFGLAASLALAVAEQVPIPLAVGFAINAMVGMAIFGAAGGVLGSSLRLLWYRLKLRP